MHAYQIVLLLGTVLGLLSCGGQGHGGSNETVDFCEATQFGVSTSLPDNTVVFQAALNSCAGRTMHVTAGTYKFAPALAYPHTFGFGTGVAIPDSTSIVGDGMGKTILQIVGAGNYASFLWIKDAGNVSLRNLTLVGNNARNPLPPAGEPACYFDYGHAVFIQSTNRPIGNISIVETEFISFTGTSWINVLGGNSENGIGIVGGPITIDNNYFKSVDGNAVAPEFIVCPSSAVAIQGLGQVSSAANVTVSGNVVNADYIKSGVAVWSGASHITIVNNTIINAGMGLPLPQHYSNGSYAIFVYQQHDVPPDTMAFVRPTAISILNNKIVNPYSSGIYVAGGQNVSMVGNIISGQVDTYDGTEPRGAIALNTLNNNFENAQTPISGNQISDCAIGISVAEGQLPIVDSNVIESIPSGGIGIKVDGTAINGATLSVTNTTIAAGENAEDVSSFIGFFPLDGLTIDGLYQAGVAYPLRWYTNVVGTSQQPQNAYCSFRAFGSVSRAYTSASVCPISPGCWTAQTAYWPYYGSGCSPGT